jgi:hypothetical protein
MLGFLPFASLFRKKQSPNALIPVFSPLQELFLPSIG